MAVYTNDLRLKEIATGDESGTWGTSTNTNLGLIADAFGFGTEAITTNADVHTTTIADGSADPGRSIFLKYTGTLDSACTITIGPNTVSKLWFIENATSGSQNIIIKQGSGATVTIPAGDTKAIYSDGAGSGGAMVDAFASLNVVDLKVEDDLTVTDDLIVNGDIDLEGSIDVNGTANLDVVDIDGAVDMASTLQVDGAITSSDGATITVNDNSAALTLKSTDDDASIGPILDLTRDSASPAADDNLGAVRFRGDDSGGNSTNYAFLNCFIEDPTDGAEDGLLKIETRVNSSSKERITMNSTATVFNDDSADLDFRVESNGQANMFFIDGADDAVVIGNNASRKTLFNTTATAAFQIEGTSGNTAAMSIVRNSNDDNGPQLVLGKSNGTSAGAVTVVTDDALLGRISFQGADGTQTVEGARVEAFVNSTPGADDMPGRLVFSTTADGASTVTERMRIDSVGRVLIGQDSGDPFNSDSMLRLQRAGDRVFMQFKTDADQDSGILFGDVDDDVECSILYEPDKKGITLSANNGNGRLFAGTTESVFNEDSENVDFRIESNSNANMLFVDAGSDHVNIATSTDHGGVLNVETTDNSVNLVLVSTDTDGSAGPILDLTRDAGNVPSDDDIMGTIRFRNDDTDLNMTQYVMLQALVQDVSSGTEDGRLKFIVMSAGTQRNFIDMSGSNAIVFNEDSQDVDFRVESNNENNAFVVNAGTDTVGIGTASPVVLTGNAVPGLTVASNGPYIVLQDRNNSDSCNYIANNSGVLQFGTNADDGGTKVEIAQFLSSGAVFNENSQSALDFRVESDAAADCFFVDAGNGVVTVNNSGGTFQGSTATSMHVRGGSTGSTSPVMMITDGDASVEGDSTILEVSFTEDGSFSTARYITFRAGSSGTQGKISGTGDGTVDYSATSDERLKENIEDTASKWDSLKAIKVRDFNWKKSGRSDTGFIAQELNEHWPNAVSEGGEDVSHDPWSVDYGKLTPILTKALQEAMEKIETLESEVAKLKGE